jgi:2-polyprenyl-3-methyl-5-hydroxy-6-metoxy-1,4-benzoquinol methylase
MADQISGLLSPFLRNRRVNVARPFLRGRVLDFGCGGGILGNYILGGDYLGVDLDRETVEIAAQTHIGHRFLLESEFDESEQFDTIVSLAVIEHIADPAALLHRFKDMLKPSGQIVLTTPNPMLDGIHGLGARIGLFSQEGHEEHVSLLNRESIGALARAVNLKVILYRRFLLGANQLVVLAHKGSVDEAAGGKADEIAREQS